MGELKPLRVHKCKMKKKLKVKITLEYWENGRGSYDGFVGLNGQPFRFANLAEEGVIKTLKNNTEWLCEELIKKIEEKKQNDRIQMS